LQKDHRPYFLKRALSKFQRFYTRHFLRPHFDSLGKAPIIIRPWHLEVFGSPIVIGDYVFIIAAADNQVRLSVWADKQIGDNCMIASGAYVTDSDWHDVYNRIAFGKTDPIDIANNVWIGDSAIVCKGVSIGENSIIGAGAVVVNSIPSNCIAAGNPAQVVKHLDPGESFTTREQWFSKRPNLFDEVDQLDRQLLGDNTLLHWLRYVFFPSRGD
jgi:acetyltransferase-like isoleucine patch superfamily enzyme